MAGPMRAQFVLTFEDQLSAGIKTLQSSLKDLRDIGKGLTLGKLGNGADALRTLASAARQVVPNISQIGAAADRSWAALKRMGSSIGKWGEHTFGPQSRVGGFAAAAEGYSVYKPIQEYAGYENILRHTAITKGLSGADAEKEIQRLNIKFNAEALETGQSSESIAQAFQDLITTGLKPDVAESLLPAHARAATAYNINPEALGHAVFALSDSFKIGHEEMPSVLSSMAMAANEGRFKVEDFSRYLPGLGAAFSSWNMTGRGAASTAFAALETVTRNSADPAQGAVNLTDALQYVGSPAAQKAFQRQGVDLDKSLLLAGQKGINPLDAFLNIISKLTKGMDPEKARLELGKYLHNQQAGTAFLALLQHRDEYNAMRNQLNQVGPQQVQTDYATARAGPQVAVNQLGEETTQLTRRNGQGFLPILHGLNVGLDWLIAKINVLDEKFPGLGDTVLASVGGLLAFGAALAAIGFVWPAISTGFSLFAGLAQAAWKVIGFGPTVFRLALGAFRLLSLGLVGGVQLVEAAFTGVGAAFEAVGAAVAGGGLLVIGVIAAILAIVVALGAAVYDIYDHWSSFSPFFKEMWEGVKSIFKGGWNFVVGLLDIDPSRMLAGWEEIKGGVIKVVDGIWKAVEKLFLDFVKWVDDWTSGSLTGAIEGIKGAWGGLTGFFTTLWRNIRSPFDQLVSDFANSWIGKHLNLGDAPQLKAMQPPSGDGAEADGGGAPGAAGPGVAPPAAQPANGRVDVGIHVTSDGQARATWTDVYGQGLHLDQGPYLGAIP